MTTSRTALLLMNFQADFAGHARYTGAVAAAMVLKPLS